MQGGADGDSDGDSVGGGGSAADKASAKRRAQARELFRLRPSRQRFEPHPEAAAG